VSGASKERSGAQPRKYCSDRCRSNKPNVVDNKIETLIMDLLSAQGEFSSQTRKDKGGSRVLVSCDEVQRLFFADQDPEDVDKQREGQVQAYRRERIRRAARRAVVFGLSHEQKTELGEGIAARSQLHQASMQPNGHLESRLFCEAVQDGKVVDPSFAKGNWYIRFRE
jgi:hypothetical protein